jgi:hypothetical protein
MVSVQNNRKHAIFFSLAPKLEISCLWFYSLPLGDHRERPFLETGQCSERELSSREAKIRY